MPLPRCSNLMIGLLIVACGLGCQTTPAPNLISCPLPSTEQVREVLKVAPLGTSREETLEKLAEAGITGSFGENQSLYYCDLWKRDESLRWHLNVVLLFDDEGKLYATRPDASGQIDPSPRSAKSATTATTKVVDDPFTY